MAVVSRRDQRERDRYAADVRKCKGGNRHWWDDYDDAGDHRAQYGTYIAFKCVRCDTIALDPCDRFGNRIGQRRYIYRDARAYREVQIGSLTEWRAQYLADIRKARRASIGLHTA